MSDEDNTTPHCIRKIIQQLKVLPILHPPSTADDALGGAELRSIALNNLLTEPLARRGLVRVRSRLGRSGRATCSGREEGRGADGQDLDGVGGLDGRDGVACGKRKEEGGEGVN
ncbi:hypothetical protein BC936DRAFT_146665 [Jimgerdemannia flammicorona]|uniref:Uncharacterized protein n=2 Tax=Jimgerdemannia flammicorona TaxID=994334 RepID=A0A433QSU8_9FUNG|nr:hypothetical protein BC936DRAFT_146665 [Jimgerdemannia flammicorona]RUS32855.1 hypothetical protein BC938DRAFT_474052 [Jimgerdemannia flammicorona]